MRDCDRTANIPLLAILSGMPNAVAVITGSRAYPSISGIARFYQTDSGVIVYTEVSGLPDNGKDGVFGYHIHEGNACMGDADDPFSAARLHYNPYGVPHPEHAGDLPPLFGGRDGFAMSLFLTDRFTAEEVIGRVAIIHGSPDDFTTQPSGNAGKKIACGIIRAC